MRASRRTALAFCMGIAALLLATAASSAPPSTDPNLCLSGGWRHLQADDGSHFKNERACLNYVAHGGILYQPTLTTVVFCFDESVDLGIFGGGFPPGVEVTLTLTGALFLNTNSNVITTVTEDGSGSSIPGTIIGQPPLAIPVHHGATTGTTPITLTARTAQGITATTTNTVFCPFP
jgi:hypothetical protein